MSTFNTEIKNLFELGMRFPTEQSCIDYLEHLYWGGELPESPFVKGSKVYRLKNNYYKCKESGKRFNVRTGTMFEASNIPLRKWFMATHMLTTHKKGISSLQLAKDIGVTQKTAWFLSQRIRATYGIENYNELDGVVECDETFYGGKNKNRHADKKVEKSHGRSFKDKTPVVGMIQRGGKMTAIVTRSTGRADLHPILREYIKDGSTLIADDWHGYGGMDKFYDHRTVKDTANGYQHSYDGDTHTNNIEGAWKIFKNSARDMYNSVSRKHLQLYVDEFVYRYNMRKFTTSDQFNWVVANSNVRTSYKDLVHGQL